jgi:hypothetical protein
MSFVEGDFTMQPLSRVKRVEATSWGSDSVMLKRPAIAVRVAQYIAEWSEVESLLGLFLALVLHTNARSGVAMYSALDNRSAQIRIIKAAAKAGLPAEHYDVVDVFINVFIQPAMKYRDKLAHWCWGHTDELPEALLIRQPDEKLANLLEAVTIQATRSIMRADIILDHDGIFVLRQTDLDQTLTCNTSPECTRRVDSQAVMDSAASSADPSGERAQYPNRRSARPGMAISSGVGGKADMAQSGRNVAV